MLGDYRTWEVKFRAFNKLKILFEESDNYGELLSTAVTLIAKEEFRDYYYTKGFEIGIEGEIIPVLTMRARFKNQTDKSAFVNTDFSFSIETKSTMLTLQSMKPESILSISVLILISGITLKMVF